MKTLNLSLWPPIFTKIKEEAQKKGLTVQAVIRNILAEHYEKTN
jgi:predicted DNA binding CopG/RHH family protein